jgi:hypothetical protein
MNYEWSIMKDESKDLRDRTNEFAIQVIRMYSTFPKSTEAQVLGKQVHPGGKGGRGAALRPE